MKTRSYKQLTQEQRYQIYAFQKAGWSQVAIAQELAVHKSTISRALRRNCGQRGYRPRQAQARATARQQQRAARPRITPATWELVEAKLQEQWSPEQIAGRLRRTPSTPSTLSTPSTPSTPRGCVSHERIYQYIYADKRAGGVLHTHLRSQKQRRKRYGSGRSRRGQIAGRVSISERPALVERRERLGDWEGDTIVGKGHQQAIVSLTERFSRFTLLHKVARATAPAVSAAIREQLGPLAEWVHTLTSDNGKEFAAHQEIAVALQADYYFAHPYASWERGLNENTNGLVRQYCPKKSDFSHLDQDAMQAIAQRLNHRPRKTLDYRTPFEVFFQQSPVALTT